MEHRVQLNWVLLVMMTTPGVTEATIVPRKFQKLDPGRTITGQILAELSTRSKLQCSDRCLDETCEAYVYTGTGPGNCLLISTNSTAEEGETFELEDSAAIYEKDNCDSNPCQNRAQCVNTDSGYKCNCLHGYLGNHCEDKVNCGQRNPCRNLGTCVDEEDSYRCICSAMLSGVHCEFCSQESDETWTSPPAWTGSSAVLYRNSDNMQNSMFTEGSELMDYVPLVSGQVNCAWNLDRTKKQWVDLGIQTEACMTRPDTCGAAGGAISLWMNVISCPRLNCGIISSYDGSTTGVRMYVHESGSRILVYQEDGDFSADAPKLEGWTHVVINYLNPDVGHKVYFNGTEVSQGSRTPRHIPAGDGRLVVGRAYTNEDRDYASVQVDELQPLPDCCRG